MDAFSFVPRKDASKLKLRTFLGKDSSKSLVYWYDFGDDWIHTIKLEAVSDEALLHALWQVRELVLRKIVAVCPAMNI